MAVKRTEIRLAVVYSGESFDVAELSIGAMKIQFFIRKLYTTILANFYKKKISKK